MKKLLVVAMMALGLGFGMSSAYAAASHYNRPQVVHNGPDYAADSGGES